MAAHATGKWKKIHSRCTEVCTRCRLVVDTLGTEYPGDGIATKDCSSHWHSHSLLNPTRFARGQYIHGHILFVHIGLRASYRPMVRFSDPGRRFHQFDKVPQGVTLMGLRGSCILVTEEEPCGQVPTPSYLLGAFLVSHSNCLSASGDRRRANVSKPELGLGHAQGAGAKG